MRFSLIDLLIAIVLIAIGAVLGRSLASDLPAYLRPIAEPFFGICVYLALIYPIYRRFRLFPIVLPLCPCCGNFQNGFHIIHGGWPHVTFRCTSFNGEFIIWYNGKPSDQETWDKPILALKWPYAFGRYKRMEKPKQANPPYSEPAAWSPQR